MTTWYLIKQRNLWSFVISNERIGLVIIVLGDGYKLKILYPKDSCGISSKGLACDIYI